MAAAFLDENCLENSGCFLYLFSAFFSSFRFVIFVTILVCTSVFADNDYQNIFLPIKVKQ